MPLNKKQLTYVQFSLTISSKSSSVGKTWMALESDLAEHSLVIDLIDSTQAVESPTVTTRRVIIMLYGEIYTNETYH